MKAKVFTSSPNDRFKFVRLDEIAGAEVIRSSWGKG
jgi:hypothetical protein